MILTERSEMGWKRLSFAFRICSFAFLPVVDACCFSCLFSPSPSYSHLARPCCRFWIAASRLWGWRIDGVTSRQG